MILHKDDAGVNILDHLSKRGVIDQSAGAGRIETSCCIIEVRIVMKIGADFVGQGFKPSLFLQKFFALRLES